MQKLDKFSSDYSKLLSFTQYADDDFSKVINILQTELIKTYEIKALENEKVFEFFKQEFVKEEEKRNYAYCIKYLVNAADLRDKKEQCRILGCWLWWNDSLGEDIEEIFFTEDGKYVFQCIKHHRLYCLVRYELKSRSYELNSSL